ncbi:MAG: ribonuclease III [Chloroflexi bacterium]|nr:ribonuclease III [Chloroflexota bacterium]
MASLAELQQQAGFTFHNVELLRRALTHRSYLNEHAEESEDNERLEFLGDAVLDFLVGAMLYHRFPEMQEGQLTRLRSALVRAEQLAGLARQLELGQYIRLGKGEDDAGGRERDTLLGDVFEAILGGLYLDSGLEAVKEFVERLLLPVAAEVAREQSDIDAKSYFQEWAQSELNHTPQYVTVSAEGPDHEKTFAVEVRVNGEVYGAGAGRSKQAAARAAAMDALKRVGAI